MPLDPDRPSRPNPLQWFALSIAGGFFISFFVYWVAAALLALSLGAVATGFDQARKQQRVSLWLALPATGVFAFVAGSFLQGFNHWPQHNLQARVLTGAGEVVMMVFTGGSVPLEGVARLSPWRHIAVSWVGLAVVALWLGAWMDRRRARR